MKERTTGERGMGIARQEYTSICWYDELDQGFLKFMDEIITYEYLEIPIY